MWAASPPRPSLNWECNASLLHFFVAEMLLTVVGSRGGYADVLLFGLTIPASSIPGVPPARPLSGAPLEDD